MMVYKLKGISIIDGSTIEFNSIEAIKSGFSKTRIIDGQIDMNWKLTKHWNL